MKEDSGLEESADALITAKVPSYRLKDNFLLRGWERLPYALVDANTGGAMFLTPAQWDAINLCDSTVDVSLPLISDKTRSIIADAQANGIVEPCAPGQALTDIQKYRKYPARYIKQAHWSITGRCNYRCKHCFMSAPSAKFSELPHSTIMDIVNQLGDCGVMNVSLTGGEPLVRPDFLEIVDALLERGIHIRTIYSNGALVNETLLRELDRRNIHPEFNMSYDGVGWHDWLRGVSGAEEAVDRAFALCRDNGFPTGAEMCLHTRNKHTLRESIRHMGKLGVRSVKTNPVSNSGEWLKNGYGESFTNRELYQLYLDYIPHYYEDGMPMGIMLGGFFMADQREPDMFHIPSYKPDCDPETFCMCGHARLVMYIAPDGRTLPCTSLSGFEIQEKFPLITEQGLAQCITDSYYMSIINTRASEYFALHDDCRECRYSRCCYGGCRADAFGDGNGLMGKSRSSCELFKGGWVDRIIDAVRKCRPGATSPVMDNPLWQN